MEGGYGMKSRKKLKGFTLIELIVVMAIFGILLVGALQLVDPVSKVMTSASVQETNSAAVDIMRKHLESSLRYVQFIETYQGNFADDADEAGYVKRFIDTYFNGRVQRNGTSADTAKPFEGRVHVMKIANGPGTGEGGRIYERAYDFTAGYGYYIDPLDLSTFTYVNDQFGNQCKPMLPASTPEYNLMMNEQYYMDYSFYFELGYRETQRLSVAAAGTDYGAAANALDPKGNSYYGRLWKPNGSSYKFSADMFSVAIVTYKNRNRNVQFGLDDKNSDGFKDCLFESPFYVANASMYLANINSGAKDPKKYFTIELDTSGSNPVARYSDPVKSPIKEVKIDPSTPLCPDIVSLPGGGNYIYFIYALASEVD